MVLYPVYSSLHFPFSICIKKTIAVVMLIHISTSIIRQKNSRFETRQRQVFSLRYNDWNDSGNRSDSLLTGVGVAISFPLQSRELR
jgi:hypothetical protein